MDCFKVQHLFLFEMFENSPCTQSSFTEINVIFYNVKDIVK